MEENRIRAYVQVIKKLLDCPSGEEVKVLREHHDLVDREFIAVMEQAAVKAAQEGNEDTANFLVSLAEQLKPIFDRAEQMMNPEGMNRTEAYLKLIEQMLSCDRGEDVARLLSQNEELLDAGLVQTLAQVAQLMTERGEKNSAAFLINLAYEISEIVQARSGGEKAGN